MKLTEKFTNLLKQSFKEVIVLDQNGDGHHIEMIMIDDVFAEKNRIDRSRYAFEKLGDFTRQVHAFTVKCFTIAEWAEKKDTFQETEYFHIR